VYILSILITIVNSCNVCVFYFCIFRNKLDVFETTGLITLAYLTGAWSWEEKFITLALYHGRKMK
jgi:hypothetical protein